MAVRKTRTGRLARAAQDERHSVRSSLVKSSRTNPTRTGRQGVTQKSLNQSDGPLLPRLMSWSDTLAAVEEQSLETQVQRYKEWKPSPLPEERNDPTSAAAPTTSAPHPDTNSSSNTHPHSSASDGPLGVCSIQQAPTGDRHDVPASDPTAPKRLYELLGNDDEATEDNVISQRPRRQRKSRYTNLPTEVDTALSVLYRELESNESLRREVEELRSENTKCNQTIRIRDLSIIALRRELDYRRSSDQEIETLRATATQLENAKEIRELQARNEALSAELQTSRDETAEAKALVRDWKAKLSQLIGN
ncbi:similar to An12g02380 [Aspergillus luchuensis]|uniref:Similar to An12g02380 n=1 Tax=Aspergillus kawachii TaxID=1069201 RepID=A0A146FFN5_ASPKA|nr:similar to An12g02380 [Aspergillus luchuensis]